MSISTARPAELVDVIASPWPARGSVKDASTRVAKIVSQLLVRDGYQPMKPSRVYDIWGGEATPRYWEMDALREAAGLAREARNDFRIFTARLERVEQITEQVLRVQEALLVQDEDFMRPHSDAVDMVRGRSDRSLDGGGA